MIHKKVLLLKKLRCTCMHNWNEVRVGGSHLGLLAGPSQHTSSISRSRMGSTPNTIAGHEVRNGAERGVSDEKTN
jgi:hypothetical protein